MVVVLTCFVVVVFLLSYVCLRFFCFCDVFIVVAFGLVTFLFLLCFDCCACCCAFIVVVVAMF